MFTVVAEKTLPWISRVEPGAGCWTQAPSRTLTTIKCVSQIYIERKWIWGIA